jgi:hypothetical protein
MSRWAAYRPPNGTSILGGRRSAGWLTVTGEVTGAAEQHVARARRPSVTAPTTGSLWRTPKQDRRRMGTLSGARRHPHTVIIVKCGSDHEIAAAMRAS